MRTPDDFDATEWFRYFLGAVERETGAPWSPPGFEVNVWLKLIKRLADDGADPYYFALALDLVAIHWERYSAVSVWELITPGMLFYRVRSMPRSPVFWRGVWYSRFAETEDEVRFYDHWLAQLEASLKADPGTAGKSALWQTAEGKLRQAEEKILRSGKPPIFSYNWLKASEL